MGKHEQEPDGLPPASQETAERLRTVLVADDEEAVREVAAELLELMGFKVILASDGHEALERFRAQPRIFDLVLVDLTTPGLDGRQVSQELRRLRADVPILLMSGYSQQEVADVTFVPPGGFLQKPFGAASLRQAVTDALGPEPTPGPGTSP